MPWALLVAAVLSQAQGAQLEAARKAVAELKYPEAKTLLQKVRQQQGLTREQLIEVLWLQGLVSASINQPDNARAAFRALFAIDPEHKAERDYPPKIMSPYYEARGWIATNKPLGFQALPAVTEGGRVKRIGVKVLADPLLLVSGVRLHVIGDEPEVTEHDLKDLAVTRDVDGEKVTWWAELIGERGAQLARVGSSEQPVVESGAAAVSGLPPGAMPGVEGEGGGGISLKTASYVTAAVGVVALGIGTIFGIRSNTVRNALRARTHDEQGVVTNWTQVEADTFLAQQRRDASVANAMFVIAGVLVAAAVILFIVGREP